MSKRQQTKPWTNDVRMAMLGNFLRTLTTPNLSFCFLRTFGNAAVTLQQSKWWNSYQALNSQNDLISQPHERAMGCLMWVFGVIWLHYIITVRCYWAGWGIKSQASRWFPQRFAQVQIKEKIKAPCHWPLWGEFTGDRGGEVKPLWAELFLHRRLLHSFYKETRSSPFHPINNIVADCW